MANMAYKTLINRLTERCAPALSTSMWLTERTAPALSEYTTSMWLTLLLCLCLTACGGDQGFSPPVATISPSASPTPSVSPAPSRKANTACIAPEPGYVDGEGNVGFTEAFPSLPALPQPVAMVQPVKDSSFWFLALRDGRVYTFNNDENAAEAVLVLDISEKVADHFEMGFTGFVVHPDYPQDNRIFALYNDASTGDWSTLSVFEVNTDTKQIDQTSENILLTLIQPLQTHNGGDLAFGPDGYLYAAFGDSGGDPFDAQVTSNLHGSIIRIDVSTIPYSIPTDNPFNTGQNRCESNAASTGQFCPEIYAYGFRNPWRFSIDHETGNLWLGDVGEYSYEEINRVSQGGGNYGWPPMEGPYCRPQFECDENDYEPPLVAYGRDRGVSALGGYVYRGSRYPDLQGKYIFGDVFGGSFYMIDENAPNNTIAEEIFQYSTAYAMAQGNDGEIYFLNAQAEATGDMILRITGNTTAQYTMPNLLSETGCFNTVEKTHPQGVFEYSVNSELWSDGANKLRAFAIPDDSVIELHTDGDFEFPIESILIKHFLSESAYLETRFLIRHATGWKGYSYEWNDAQSDAVLLDEGKTKDVGSFVHTFPSSTQCNICHTSAAKNSLGLELAQLNANSPMQDINFIDYLSEAGYLAQTIASVESPELYALDDEDASSEERARSYLHSNCSGCHRNQGANNFMDFRYSVTLANMNICDVLPSFGNLGAANSRRLSPGNAEASTIVLRMNTLEQHRMPPLASQAIDTVAVQVISDWINGLSHCQ